MPLIVLVWVVRGWLQIVAADAGGGEGFFNGLLSNIRSAETIKAWGEKLIRQHRPAHLLKLPDFMQPKSPRTTAPVDQRTHNNRGPSEPSSSAKSDAADLARKLICAHCRTKISFPEGKFCWNNEKRFGGLQYCREHQDLFR